MPTIPSRTAGVEETEEAMMGKGKGQLEGLREIGKPATTLLWHLLLDL